MNGTLLIVGRWVWLCASLLGAPEGDAIGVAPTEFAGDTSASDRKALHAAVAAGIERAGLRQVPADGTQEVRWVLQATVTSEDRLYAVQLEARDRRDGSVVASSKHPCEPCGRDEVRELIEREVAALASRVARIDATPAVLAIDSEPSGARVLVDGEHVGATPIEVRLTPGEHEIETQLEGYASQRRTLEAVPGVSERWTAKLHADGSRVSSKAIDDGPRKREPLWPTGWALVGTGVASLAVGVTFLALHHRPYRSRCSGDDYDASNDLCRYRWTSLPQGVALTVVGGALLVTGAVLAGVGRKRRQAAQARVDVHRGGAAIVVEGRF